MIKTYAVGARLYMEEQSSRAADVHYASVH